MFSIITNFIVFQSTRNCPQRVIKIVSHGEKLLLNHCKTVPNFRRSVDKKDIKYQINTDQGSVLTYIYLQHILVRVNMAADICFLIKNFGLH